jgi:hypothetical protein
LHLPGVVASLLQETHAAHVLPLAVAIFRSRMCLTNCGLCCCPADSAATNYDQLYTSDDGSCSYGGCLDPANANFAPLATFELPDACASERRERRELLAPNATSNATSNATGCMDPGAVNYDPLAITHDGSLCSFAIIGCMDSIARNFFSAATSAREDSCQYTRRGCMSPTGLNYDSTANEASGCIYGTRGCNDPRATNCESSALCVGVRPSRRAPRLVPLLAPARREWPCAGRLPTRLLVACRRQVLVQRQPFQRLRRLWMCMRLRGLHASRGVEL